MKRLAAALAVLFAGASAFAEPPAAGSWKLSVDASQTAIWVGDRFEYTIRVQYGEGVEFVADHLKKEELNLQPFEVVNAAVTTGTAQAGGQKFLELKLLLTTYAVNPAAELQIPPVTLFYFKQGGQSPRRDDTPAETLVVPAYRIAVRNTVIDASTGLRDRRDPLPIRPISLWLWSLLGWTGLALILAAVLWKASQEYRARTWQNLQVARDRSRKLREAVEHVRQMPVANDREMSAFYDEASEVLRGLAAERLDQDRGLTPDELRTALVRAGDSETHAQILAALVEICDETRYAPNGLEYGKAKHAEFLRKFEELTG